MDARAAIILVGAMGLGSGAATASCEAGFTAGPGSGGSATATTSGSAAASSSGTGMACTTAKPDVCGTGAYCLMGGADCNVATGHCVAFPATSVEEDPLCGCDGVTYWNGAVASGHDQAIWFAGVCGTQGHTCGAGTQCDGMAKCNLNVPDTQCAMQQPQGSCWILPSACPPKGVGGHACAMGSACATVCSLIDAEMPWTTPAMACTP